MSELTLETPIQFVKGVGPRRAQQLAQLGVETLEDLLSYFPRKFNLRKQRIPIADLDETRVNATVVGVVQTVKFTKFPRPIFEALIEDESASLRIRWFHGAYLQGKIRPGITLAASGKLSRYRDTLQFVNPNHQILFDPDGSNLDADELLPVYPAGANLSSNVIASVIRNVLPHIPHVIRDWCDAPFLAERDLLPRAEAVLSMHHPEDREQWKRARRRLAYDECLLMQLGIAILRNREISRPAHALPSSEEIDQRIRRRFPFDLTDAQSRVSLEIAADLARPRPMNRLVQGDVGSGKTVVALYAALLAVANRKQAALMAPTEILATQHYKKIMAYLEGSRVNVALLTGSTPKPKRQRILAELETGQIHLVIGTHAILSDTVKFQDLALVIVDEQHKFGVRQRSNFRTKGFSPHYLVMTATPIPRTLTMTVFGDLDSSIIDELPPGRGTTETICLQTNQLEQALCKVEGLLEAGQQAYFIYPLVNTSDTLELTAAIDAARSLRDGPLGHYGVGLLHGQMKPDEKNDAMKAFRDGKTRILVASVVVEVGVDVPNANVIVIHHAERFGLAQLHQLRGRVGRAGEDALCVLLADPANPIATERMAALVRTSNGFEIAEEDLRLRGPGQIFGTRQHGLPELQIADLVEDFDLLRLARRDAFATIAEDPDLAAPHHQQLRRLVKKLYAGKLNLLAGA
ncbi:MAG: ATP-dependent DNA helicase RecG [Phycisphaerales bacterium]|jgi:ATP-dependent DNA helicase RecG|nr:ATP-dependent DNA helicase RecG [Phycisphaerales bacterium]MBT7171857.1 ATP-dependent DNA helicase RecG [Phycisphaerales bacterium]